MPDGLCVRRGPWSGRWRVACPAEEVREVESSWESRDLPVLDAVVRLFDDHPEVTWVTVKGIADDVGMPPIEVYRAAKALSPTYLILRETLADEPEPHRIEGVTDDARRAVGQWPSPTSVADGIIRELLAAADREPDEAKRTKLRAAADALGGFGRDLLINVVANVATKPIGF
jgi:hypothetical protein